MQDILVYIALGLAIGFLVKKYFFKSTKDDNCGPGCGSCKN
ncbi:FeoB-associated Cys-rich membrane protein [Lutibacter citreus]|nr:FeoB-associated Cys-rich membrane protein [Lutibacter citreus]